MARGLALAAAWACLLAAPIAANADLIAPPPSSSPATSASPSPSVIATAVSASGGGSGGGGGGGGVAIAVAGLAAVAVAVGAFAVLRRLTAKRGETTGVRAGEAIASADDEADS